ncbi:hypothetical protein KGA66_03065 [Actinocrinis puniceicyclus]|uniref:Uncharacterized protein n=1 Tax=Actinocrinis puniceicyclus TaxID=977794 RepID=A0A8J7WIM8_9ACTN|nr:hypothetical protein [Actinocrinis puniceicyclus]MBS2962013.1 hypothetical protein [Actinocrinis puniceicyclus]
MTEFGVHAGGRGPGCPYRVRRLAVTFDRPFGFVAVHRGSALVLACGRIEEPGRGGRGGTVDLAESGWYSSDTP